MSAARYYFSNINRIRIAADDSQIVDCEEYIAIREEINRLQPSDPQISIPAKSQPVSK
ncbi:MAG: hypothetical protein ACJA04_000890 [Cellvibrionaceae bacterium]|jgi:hypothetical protein